MQNDGLSIHESQQLRAGHFFMWSPLMRSHIFKVCISIIIFMLFLSMNPSSNVNTSPLRKAPKPPFCSGSHFLHQASWLPIIYTMFILHAFPMGGLLRLSNQVSSQLKLREIKNLAYPKSFIFV